MQILTISVDVLDADVLLMLVMVDSVFVRLLLVMTVSVFVCFHVSFLAQSSRL